MELSANLLGYYVMPNSYRCNFSDFHYSVSPLYVSCYHFLISHHILNILYVPYSVLSLYVLI